jgi:hypothetical protein
MSREFTRDIQREVSAGRVGNAQRFSLAGINNNIPIGAETLLWGLGGSTYTYLTTATQLYASSTDAGDNAFMGALGIDNETDGLLTTRLFQLDGQNKVPLSGLMYRIFFFFPVGSGNFNGDIYVYEDDTVIAGVPQTFSKIKCFATNQETGVNGTYRVPNNAEAYFDNYKVLIDPKKRFDINQKSKSFGMTNFAYVRFPTNPQVLEWSPRFRVPARTDLEYTATAKDNNSKITFLAEGVLEFE